MMYQENHDSERLQYSQEIMCTECLFCCFRLASSLTETIARKLHQLSFVQ